ncbi:MAG: hypothetical protein WAU42_11975 [Solirubrobacteraceae bacterium]
MDGIEIYGWQRASGETCVLNIKIDGGGGASCGNASEVEREGIVGIHQEGEGAGATLRVVALVPNGVKNVDFTDRNGASHLVSVIKNVVALEDANLASVNYALPGEAAHTVNVASVVEHTAHASPLPNSSKSAPE